MLSEKLQELGIELPEISAPLGAYVPAKRTGQMVFIAGQLPMLQGKLLASGPVVSRCSLEQARRAARQCVVNALGAVRSLEGRIDHLLGVLRMGVFVCSDPDFTQQPKVADGASELLLELFGQAGRHVRAAVGVNVLPLDASVEVELVFLSQ